MRYTTLSDLGTDVAALNFKPMPGAKEPPAKREPTAPWPSAALTIPEAKKALAATCRVKPDAL